MNFLDPKVLFNEYVTSYVSRGDVKSIIESICKEDFEDKYGGLKEQLHREIFKRMLALFIKVYEKSDIDESNFKGLLAFYMAIKLLENRDTLNDITDYLDKDWNKLKKNEIIKIRGLNIDELKETFNYTDLYRYGIVNEAMENPDIKEVLEDLNKRYKKRYGELDEDLRDIFYRIEIYKCFK
ncbi:MAG: hypothetical protein ARM1_0643 [Candidatus Micrarchaeota archaeon]|nr:MAG: hypothetical protein ARM1_0643 [Candidatus Micrarchaeota archaeon]